MSTESKNYQLKGEMALVTQETKTPETVAASSKPTERISLAQQAYDALKRKIFILEFAPGSYLNEAMIAEDLKIGRNPVHNAVKRLVFDGLLDIIPRKGLIVRPLDLTEILEISEARRINETYCVRLAAERASADDIKQMKNILRTTKRAISARDVEAQMFLDRDFHCAIFRSARNKVMEEMLRQLHERSLRNWFVSLKESEQSHKVLEEHSAIVEAIEARDADKAEESMRFHIRSSRENLQRQV